MATVGKYIVGIKTTNDAYAALVAETINGLVTLLGAELKAQTKTCESLCDALRPIFNTTSKFYLNHFQEEPLPDKP